MPHVVMYVPIHLKAGVERYLSLMQQRETQLQSALKARVVYSISCGFCRRSMDLDSVTLDEAQEILIQKGWRQITCKQDWKLKPACPVCVNKTKLGVV